MNLSLKTVSALFIAVSLFACASGDSPSTSQNEPVPNDGPAPGNPGDPNGPSNPNPGPSNNPGPSSNPGPNGKVNPIDSASTAKQLTDPGETGFFDGPVWFDNALYFSNYDNRMIVKYFAGVADPFSQVRLTTGFQPIGSTFDSKTNEFLTVEVQQNGPAQIVRSQVNSPAVPLTINVVGTPWNSPNDLVLRSDGSFFVTDPGYQQDTNILNRVYFVATDGTASTAATYNNAERPNGLALSLDEKVLYVSLTATGQIMKYSVNEDGTLSLGSVFISSPGSDPDGMSIDQDGNLYVATNKGIDVYSSDGKKWGTLATDHATSNLTFGGVDFKTLFVTAAGAVYQFDNLKVAGTNQ